MVQHRVIGNWRARQVEADASPAGMTNGAEPDRPPTRRPDSETDEANPRRSERGLAFGLGLLVGLVPLIAVAGGFVGYLIARDTESEDQTAVGETEAVEAGSGAATVTTEADGAGGSAPSSTERSPSTEVAQSPIEVVAPTAEVRDGRLVIEGTLPADAAEGYLREVSRLADALGYEIVEETTVEDGAPVPSEIPVRFTEAVFFDAGSDQLEMDFLPQLDAVADYLIGGSATVTIVSHTDASGSEASNLHLAQHRAGVVFEYLTERGVEPSRIRVEPRGELEASGAEGREAGTERRVEFVFGVEL